MGGRTGLLFIIDGIFDALGAVNPAIIFWLGTVIATVSLGCSFLVPRHQVPGAETVLRRQRGRNRRNENAANSAQLLLSLFA